MCEMNGHVWNYGDRVKKPSVSQMVGTIVPRPDNPADRWECSLRPLRGHLVWVTWDASKYPQVACPERIDLLEIVNEKRKK